MHKYLKSLELALLFSKYLQNILKGNSTYLHIKVCLQVLGSTILLCEKTFLVSEGVMPLQSALVDADYKVANSHLCLKLEAEATVLGCIVGNVGTRF